MASRQQLSPVDGLAQLSFVVQGMLERRAAEHGLSIIQARLLGVLRDRKPTMNELARLLGLDKSSVTGLVDRAERRGLVIRVPSTTDRRAVLVSLTDEGLGQPSRRMHMRHDGEVPQSADRQLGHRLGGDAFEEERGLGERRRREAQREARLLELETRITEFESAIRRRLEEIGADADAERAVVEARVQELLRRLESASSLQRTS